MANKDLQDEQFDKVMRSLIADASLDASAADEIADSPAMWWAIKREIETQKPARLAWPPVEKIRLWLAAGVPAVTFAAVLVAFFLYDSRTVTHVDVAGALIAPAAADRNVPGEPMVRPELGQRANGRLKSIAAASKPIPSRASVRTSTKAPAEAEIKSDFIALSYAGDASSGQIVRVKVPSAMMVAVGLVRSVEKPSALVDAELVVGDDGLTRAIRFIRN